MRLFEGTQWDCPPTCQRCGKLETDCKCPSPTTEELRIPPEQQTAIVSVEKRKKGKLVTVLTGLEPQPLVIAELFTRLKSACGSGGTIRDASVEIQGDHQEKICGLLEGLGYRVKRR
jgi:translation initiation factor 1